VLRCLAKAPADRYSDAEAEGQALAACAASGEWDGRHAATWWQESFQRTAVQGDLHPESPERLTGR